MVGRATFALHTYRKPTNSMKNILFLLGTAREGRMSERVARFVVRCAKERGDIDVAFVDVADFSQSKTKGNSVAEEAWDAFLQKADGLVIISPEYNHGYPGELKLFLDNAYEAYAGKPVAICGVSNGSVGGARMAEQLKLVLSAFQMIVINAAVYFVNVDEHFDDSGNTNAMDLWKKKVNGMLDQVIKYSK